jgi:hypothetical protein
MGRIEQTITQLRSNPRARDIASEGGTKSIRCD